MGAGAAAGKHETRAAIPQNTRNHGQMCAPEARVTGGRAKKAGDHQPAFGRPRAGDAAAIYLKANPLQTGGATHRFCGLHQGGWRPT